MSEKMAYRGMLFYFKDTATLATLPQHKQDSNSQYVFIEDGILVVESGKIVAVGAYTDLKNKIANLKLIHYPNQLITPGFIDSHLHATQSAIVAAYGKKLLEWLQTYVFPSESAYRDIDIAQKDLSFFLNYLIKSGTTTAVAYGPLFDEAADFLFSEIHQKNMRFITGNALMDFNSPKELTLSAQQNYDICQKLIAKWHNKDRISFCISPRFALACSEELLELCGTLKKEHPTAYIQTHLNENQNEIVEAKRLFPWSKNYLDIYDRFGLVTDRSIFGHCIHNTDEELALLAERKSILTWCPLSNNFLGSGLFNVAHILQQTDKIALGTDWGAGPSLSMLATMRDAYNVSMLNNANLSPMAYWYCSTLGAAKALQIADKIGTFKPGHEADFIVIDPEASPLLKYRNSQIDHIFDLLFMLIILADEQCIQATYINGEPAYLSMNEW